MKLIYKKKKGFSLLEILLVLAIAAAIVGAAFLIYQKVQTSNEIKKEINNIGTIRAGLTSLYGSVASPSANLYMNPVAINAKLIPDNMLTTTSGEIKSSWGPVYIGATYLDSGKLGFIIRYENVTNEVCAKLASAMANGFNEIKIAASNKGITGIPSGGGVAIKSSTVDFSIASATTSCKMYSSSEGQNQLMFGFL